MSEDVNKNIKDSFEIDWSDLLKFGLLIIILLSGIYFWSAEIPAELSKKSSIELKKNIEFVQGINTEGDLLVFVSPDAFSENEFINIFAVLEGSKFGDKRVSLYGITNENSLLVYTTFIPEKNLISTADIPEVPWYYAVNREFKDNSLIYSVVRYSYWVYAIYVILAIVVLGIVLSFAMERCVGVKSSCRVYKRYFILRPCILKGT